MCQRGDKCPSSKLSSFQHNSSFCLVRYLQKASETAVIWMLRISKIPLCCPSDNVKKIDKYCNLFLMTKKQQLSYLTTASPLLRIRVKQITEKKCRIELLFQYLIDLLLCFIEHISTLSNQHHRNMNKTINSMMR